MQHGRTEKTEDVVKKGDRVRVKLIDRDERGRLRLSRKALLPPPEGGEGGGSDGGNGRQSGGGEGEAQEPVERAADAGRGERGERGGGRGDRPRRGGERSRRQ